jgi:SAM-dependent methyltransferase
MQHTPQSFDAKFEASNDPWQFRSRWYEQRKRALTLASLPAARYDNAFEPGCANGELSAALAERCGRLLATDGSEKAVELARSRLAASTNVEVRRAWLPDEWPDGRFDLIVFSEVGYFMDAATLTWTAQCIRTSIGASGTLLACHWRRQADDCEIDGNQVHAILNACLALPKVLAYADEDILLEVWSGDDRSVATVDGIVQD